MVSTSMERGPLVSTSIERGDLGFSEERPMSIEAFEGAKHAEDAEVGQVGRRAAVKVPLCVYVVGIEYTH